MAKVKLLEREGNRISLLLEGVPLQVVNAIRRTIMADVPTLAIDEVYIVENSSLMYDEILAHRLGLIPLTTNLDKYKLPEEATREEEAFVRLFLEVDAGTETKIVYSGDLKSEDPDVRPASDKIPIVLLAPGQRISLEARARLGTAKEHAKWSPVSIAVHKYIPKIDVREDLCEKCGACIETCPKGVLEFKEGKITLTDPIKCSLCMQCVKACKTKALDLSWYEDKFVFTYESTGALPVERIFFEALKILKRKIEVAIKELEMIKQ